MFVVEVEIIRQWTDRGGKDWVEIRVAGDTDQAAIGGVPEALDVEPEKIIQLKRTLVQTFGHTHDDS